MARRVARDPVATPMLTPRSLAPIQAALSEAGLDGWLLYDFRGLNPVAASLLGFHGLVTRRIFCWIPARGMPVAITHAIEQGPWAEWPTAWEKVIYSSWRVLEEALPRLVRGKRIAMEYSPGDAVPVVDRVPAGVLELVRAAGADVVTSAELVTRFFAVWSDAEIASHHKNAEALRALALEVFAQIGRAARTASPLHEHEVAAWLREGFARHGMEADHGPIVAATENAANPHYEPSAASPRAFREGDVALIDLFATAPGGAGMWADQTWMASIGAPSKRALEVWTAVRDARDAAIALLQVRLAAGTPVRGGEADNAARAVIESRGFGAYFTHRTGHSIDARGLHGMGPNIDDLETRETRLLVPGVGFSIEPGVYLTGEIGMRSEVNAYVGRDGRLVVTPAEIQRDLIVV